MRERFGWFFALIVEEAIHRGAGEKRKNQSDGPTTLDRVIDGNYGNTGGKEFV